MLSSTVLFIPVLIFPNAVLGVGIIGGKPSELYPFFVIVRKGDNFCGGTLWSANSVVTAAHCVYYKSKNRWAQKAEVHVLDADFTQSDWQTRAKKFECEDYRAHGDYDPSLNDGVGPYDIALIKLKGKFDMDKSHNAVIKPCSMKGTYKYGTAVGLGLTNQRPDEFAEHLMEVVLQRDEHCGEFDKYPELVNLDLQLCYSIPGKASTCMGDSGGPIIYKEKSKVVCLIGVVSFNEDKCVDPDFPSVFTAVSVFENWIKRQIRSMKDSYKKKLINYQDLIQQY